MRTSSFVLIGSVLTAAACTDSSLNACDNANRDVTLVNVAGNVASGNFNQCIADLELELQIVRQEGIALRNEEVRLRALAEQLSGEERAAAKRLAVLNAEQAELATRIADKGGAAPEANVARALAVERNLREDIEKTSKDDGVSAAEAEALKARQREVDSLLIDLL